MQLLPWNLIDFIDSITKLWHYLAKVVHLRNTFSEYFKLANIAIVQVIGSVEDERAFQLWISWNQSSKIDCENTFQWLWECTPNFFLKLIFFYDAACDSLCASRNHENDIWGLYKAIIYSKVHELLYCWNLNCCTFNKFVVKTN